jgi:geranylgeranylglycerol-phosphate geranylgeranyltransferase
MNPLLEVTRPSVCFLAIFGMVIGLSLINIPQSLWIFPILSAAFICAAGNAINDYFDAEIDRINRPKRPIPSGRLSRNSVRVLYIGLNFMGLIFAYFVSLNFFIFALFNSGVLYFYSKSLKKTVLGNLADTYLAVAVFIAPALILGGFSGILASPLLVLAYIPFFANYSREIIKDIEDAEGDRALGAKTLPITLGKGPAFLFAKALLLVAAASLFAPYLSGIFPEGYLIFAVFGATGCLHIISLDNAPKMQKLLKALMFYVLGVFLAFSI